MIWFTFGIVLSSCSLTLWYSDADYMWLRLTQMRNKNLQNVLMFLLRFHDEQKTDTYNVVSDNWQVYVTSVYVPHIFVMLT